jgi:hypothetical protein
MEPASIPFRGAGLGLDIRVIGACDVIATVRKAIQKQERRKREALKRRAQELALIFWPILSLDSSPEK